MLRIRQTPTRFEKPLLQHVLLSAIRTVEQKPQMLQIPDLVSHGVRPFLIKFTLSSAMTKIV